jgi:hypothetical protein
MTRQQLLEALAALFAMDEGSIQALADALLLDFLLTEGYADVVEAYLAVLPSQWLMRQGDPHG